LEVIKTLDRARNHIGDHIRTLEQDSLLKWKCALVQHRTYGVKADYIPTSNAKFHLFLEAIRLSPTSKILIRLVMEDPVVQAKKLEAVCPISYIFLSSSTS
jgi:thermostable 8-oxoguanine DNA glycosylase